MGKSAQPVLLQGTLDLLILHALQRGAMHGYAIAQTIHLLSDEVLKVIEDLWRDLIYAGRGLRRSPALVLSALLSLGLGIGANTAIFQLINAVKLRSLPVQRPNELAEVRIAGGHGGMGMNQGQYPELTRPVWQEIRTQQQAFSGVFAWTADGANVGPASDLHRVKAIWVTGDFFHARCPTLARTADSVGG